MMTKLSTFCLLTLLIVAPLFGQVTVEGEDPLEFDLIYSETADNGWAKNDSALCLYATTTFELNIETMFDSLDVYNLDFLIKAMSDKDTCLLEVVSPAGLKDTVEVVGDYSGYILTYSLIQNGKWLFSFINDLWVPNEYDRNLFIDNVTYNAYKDSTIKNFPITLNKTAGITCQIGWDKNSEDDMRSYKIYVMGGYYATVDHPDTTVHLDLWPLIDTFYKVIYFNVTAVDSAGNESALSNTIGTIFCQEDGQLLGDVNDDDEVSNIDWSLMKWQLGTTIANVVDPVLREKYRKYDLNGDGRILSDDLSYERPLLGHRK